jgi:hypothetical protein
MAYANTTTNKDLEKQMIIATATDRREPEPSLYPSPVLSPTLALYPSN